MEPTGQPGWGEPSVRSPWPSIIAFVPSSGPLSLDTQPVLPPLTVNASSSSAQPLPVVLDSLKKEPSDGEDEIKREFEESPPLRRPSTLAASSSFISELSQQQVQSSAVPPVQGVKKEPEDSSSRIVIIGPVRRGRGRPRKSIHSCLVTAASHRRVMGELKQDNDASGLTPTPTRGRGRGDRLAEVMRARTSSRIQERTSPPYRLRARCRRSGGSTRRCREQDVELSSYPIRHVPFTDADNPDMTASPPTPRFSLSLLQWKKSKSVPASAASYAPQDQPNGKHMPPSASSLAVSLPSTTQPAQVSSPPSLLTCLPGANMTVPAAHLAPTPTSSFSTTLSPTSPLSGLQVSASSASILDPGQSEDSGTCISGPGASTMAQASVLDAGASISIAAGQARLSTPSVISPCSVTAQAGSRSLPAGSHWTGAGPDPYRVPLMPQPIHSLQMPWRYDYVPPQRPMWRHDVLPGKPANIAPRSKSPVGQCQEQTDSADSPGGDEARTPLTPTKSLTTSTDLPGNVAATTDEQLAALVTLSASGPSSPYSSGLPSPTLSAPCSPPEPIKEELESSYKLARQPAVTTSRSTFTQVTSSNTVPPVMVVGQHSTVASRDASSILLSISSLDAPLGLTRRPLPVVLLDAVAMERPAMALNQAEGRPRPPISVTYTPATGVSSILADEPGQGHHRPIMPSRSRFEQSAVRPLTPDHSHSKAPLWKPSLLLPPPTPQYGETLTSVPSTSQGLSSQLDWLNDQQLLMGKRKRDKSPEVDVQQPLAKISKPLKPCDEAQVNSRALELLSTGVSSEQQEMVAEHQVALPCDEPIDVDDSEVLIEPARKEEEQMVKSKLVDFVIDGRKANLKAGKCVSFAAKVTQIRIPANIRRVKFDALRRHREIFAAISQYWLPMRQADLKWGKYHIEHRRWIKTESKRDEIIIEHPPESTLVALRSDEQMELGLEAEVARRLRANQQEARLAYMEYMCHNRQLAEMKQINFRLAARKASDQLWSQLETSIMDEIYERYLREDRRVVAVDNWKKLNPELDLSPEEMQVYLDSAKFCAYWSEYFMFQRFKQFCRKIFYGYCTKRRRWRLHSIEYILERYLDWVIRFHQQRDPRFEMPPDVVASRDWIWRSADTWTVPQFVFVLSFLDNLDTWYEENDQEVLKSDMEYIEQSKQSKLEYLQPVSISVVEASKMVLEALHEANGGSCPNEQFAEELLMQVLQGTLHQLVNTICNTQTVLHSNHQLTSPLMKMVLLELMKVQEESNKDCSKSNKKVGTDSSSIVSDFSKISSQLSKSGSESNKKIDIDSSKICSDSIKKALLESCKVDSDSSKEIGSDSSKIGSDSRNNVVLESRKVNGDFGKNPSSKSSRRLISERNVKRISKWNEVYANGSKDIMKDERVGCKAEKKTTKLRSKTSSSGNQNATATAKGVTFDVNPKVVFDSEPNYTPLTTTIEEVLSDDEPSDEECDERSKPSASSSNRKVLYFKRIQPYRKTVVQFDKVEFIEPLIKKRAAVIRELYDDEFRAEQWKKVERMSELDHYLNEIYQGRLVEEKATVIFDELERKHRHRNPFYPDEWPIISPLIFLTDDLDVDFQNYKLGRADRETASEREVRYSLHRLYPRVVLDLKHLVIMVRSLGTTRYRQYPSPQDPHPSKPVLHFLHFLSKFYHTPEHLKWCEQIHYGLMPQRFRDVEVYPIIHGKAYQLSRFKDKQSDHGEPLAMKKSIVWTVRKTPFVGAIVEVAHDQGDDYGGWCNLDGQVSQRNVPEKFSPYAPVVSLMEHVPYGIYVVLATDYPRNRKTYLQLVLLHEHKHTFELEWPSWLDKHDFEDLVSEWFFHLQAENFRLPTGFMWQPPKALQRNAYEKPPALVGGLSAQLMKALRRCAKDAKAIKGSGVMPDEQVLPGKPLRRQVSKYLISNEDDKQEDEAMVKLNRRLDHLEAVLWSNVELPPVEVWKPLGDDAKWEHLLPDKGKKPKSAPKDGRVGPNDIVRVLRNLYLMSLESTQEQQQHCYEADLHWLQGNISERDRESALMFLHDVGHGKWCHVIPKCWAEQHRLLRHFLTSTMHNTVEKEMEKEEALTSAKMVLKGGISEQLCRLLQALQRIKQIPPSKVRDRALERAIESTKALSPDDINLVLDIAFRGYRDKVSEKNRWLIIRFAHFFLTAIDVTTFATCIPMQMLDFIQILKQMNALMELPANSARFVPLCSEIKQKIRTLPKENQTYIVQHLYRCFCSNDQSEPDKLSLAILLDLVREHVPTHLFQCVTMVAIDSCIRTYVTAAQQTKSHEMARQKCLIVDLISRISLPAKAIVLKSIDKLIVCETLNATIQSTIDLKKALENAVKCDLKVPKKTHKRNSKRCKVKPAAVVVVPPPSPPPLLKGIEQEGKMVLAQPGSEICLDDFVRKLKLLLTIPPESSKLNAMFMEVSRLGLLLQGDDRRKASNYMDNVIAQITTVHKRLFHSLKQQIFKQHTEEKMDVDEEVILLSEEAMDVTEESSSLPSLPGSSACNMSNNLVVFFEKLNQLLLVEKFNFTKHKSMLIEICTMAKGLSSEDGKQALQRLNTALELVDFTHKHKAMLIIVSYILEENTPSTEAKARICISNKLTLFFNDVHYLLKMNAKPKLIDSKLKIIKAKARFLTGKDRTQAVQLLDEYLESHDYTNEQKTGLLIKVKNMFLPRSLLATYPNLYELCKATECILRIPEDTREFESTLALIFHKASTLVLNERRLALRLCRNYCQRRDVPSRNKKIVNRIRLYIHHTMLRPGFTLDDLDALLQDMAQAIPALTVDRDEKFKYFVTKVTRAMLRPQYQQKILDKVRDRVRTTLSPDDRHHFRTLLSQTLNSIEMTRKERYIGQHVTKLLLEIMHEPYTPRPRPTLDDIERKVNSLSVINQKLALKHIKSSLNKTTSLRTRYLLLQLKVMFVKCLSGKEKGLLPVVSSGNDGPESTDDLLELMLHQLVRPILTPHIAANRLKMLTLQIKALSLQARRNAMQLIDKYGHIYTTPSQQLILLQLKKLFCLEQAQQQEFNLSHLQSMFDHLCHVSKEPHSVRADRMLTLFLQMKALPTQAQQMAFGHLTLLCKKQNNPRIVHRFRNLFATVIATRGEQPMTIKSLLLSLLRQLPKTLPGTPLSKRMFAQKVLCMAMMSLPAQSKMQLFQAMLKCRQIDSLNLADGILVENLKELFLKACLRKEARSFKWKDLVAMLQHLAEALALPRHCKQRMILLDQLAFVINALTPRQKYEALVLINLLSINSNNQKICRLHPKQKLLIASLKALFLKTARSFVESYRLEQKEQEQVYQWLRVGQRRADLKELLHFTQHLHLACKLQDKYGYRYRDRTRHVTKLLRRKVKLMPAEATQRLLTLLGEVQEAPDKCKSHRIRRLVKRYTVHIRNLFIETWPVKVNDLIRLVQRLAMEMVKRHTNVQEHDTKLEWLAYRFHRLARQEFDQALAQFDAFQQSVHKHSPRWHRVLVALVDHIKTCMGKFRAKQLLCKIDAGLQGKELQLIKQLHLRKITTGGAQLAINDHAFARLAVCVSKFTKLVHQKELSWNIVGHALQDITAALHLQRQILSAQVDNTTQQGPIKTMGLMRDYRFGGRDSDKPCHVKPVFARLLMATDPSDVTMRPEEYAEKHRSQVTGGYSRIDFWHALRWTWFNRFNVGDPLVEMPIDEPIRPRPLSQYRHLVQNRRKQKENTKNQAQKQADEIGQSATTEQFSLPEQKKSFSGPTVIFPMADCVTQELVVDQQRPNKLVKHVDTPPTTTIVPSTVEDEVKQPTLSRKEKSCKVEDAKQLTVRMNFDRNDPYGLGLDDAQLGLEASKFHAEHLQRYNYLKNEPNLRNKLCSRRCTASHCRRQDNLHVTLAQLPYCSMMCIEQAMENEVAKQCLTCGLAVNWRNKGHWTAALPTANSLRIKVFCSEKCRKEASQWPLMCRTCQGQFGNEVFEMKPWGHVFCSYKCTMPYRLVQVDQLVRCLNCSHYLTYQSYVYEFLYRTIKTRPLRKVTLLALGDYIQSGSRCYSEHDPVRQPVLPDEVPYAFCSIKCKVEMNNATDQCDLCLVCDEPLLKHSTRVVCLLASRAKVLLCASNECWLIYRLMFAPLVRCHNDKCQLVKKQTDLLVLRHLNKVYFYCCFACLDQHQSEKPKELFAALFDDADGMSISTLLNPPSHCLVMEQKYCLVCGNRFHHPQGKKVQFCSRPCHKLWMERRQAMAKEVNSIGMIAQQLNFASAKLKNRLARWRRKPVFTGPRRLVDASTQWPIGKGVPASTWTGNDISYFGPIFIPIPTIIPIECDIYNPVVISTLSPQVMEVFMRYARVPIAIRDKFNQILDQYRAQPSSSPVVLPTITSGQPCVPEQGISSSTPSRAEMQWQSGHVQSSTHVKAMAQGSSSRHLAPVVKPSTTLSHASGAAPPSRSRPQVAMASLSGKMQLPLVATSPQVPHAQASMTQALSTTTPQLQQAQKVKQASVSASAQLTAQAMCPEVALQPHSGHYNLIPANHPAHQWRLQPQQQHLQPSAILVNSVQQPFGTGKQEEHVSVQAQPQPPPPPPLPPGPRLPLAPSGQLPQYLMTRYPPGHPATPTRPPFIRVLYVTREQAARIQPQPQQHQLPMGHEMAQMAPVTIAPGHLGPVTAVTGQLGLGSQAQLSEPEDRHQQQQ